MQRQFPSIISDEDKHKVYPLLSIKITGQTKHTQLHLIACISRNFSWTIVFTTKLFFWQVCVCSAKGDTPFSFFFFFILKFLSFFVFWFQFLIFEFEFGSFVSTRGKHFQCIACGKCAKAN